MAEDGSSTRDFGTSPPPQHYSPLPVLTPRRTLDRDPEPEEEERNTILPPIYDEVPSDMPAAPILSSSEATCLDVNGSSLPLLDSRSGKRPVPQSTNKDIFPPQKTLHSKYQTPLLPFIAADDNSRVDWVPPPSPKAYTNKKRKARRKQERKRLPDVPPMTITSVGPTEERRAFKTEVPPLTPSDSFVRWWTRARTVVHGRPLPAPSSPTPGEIALKRHLLDRHPDPPQTAPPDVNFYLGTGEGAREIDPVEFWKRKLVARTKQMGRDLTAGVRYWTRFPMNKARSFPRKETVSLLTP
ncbi:PREDICTED: uncharacterized protein LOC109474864 [Branchiostoma belcheri]|uniref:Uncharacterized protein LOC109474864 n=1 Tax=Branchiostoma belcheri TaxID=7741 RepID=A0A6P4ZAG8_BRABE|nr:PREDICTED: uncharacterized protein LOC109474864 [Branchiostoma belcheri]